MGAADPAQAYFDEILETFREFEEWVPCVGRVLQFLVEIPQADELVLFELADAYESAAAGLSSSLADAVPVGSAIASGWSGDGAAAAFSRDWDAYQRDVSSTVEGLTATAGLVRASALGVETMKASAAAALFTLAMAIYAAIMAVVATFGLSAVAAEGAFAACEAAIRQAAAELLALLEREGAKTVGLTFAKDVAAGAVRGAVRAGVSVAATDAAVQAGQVAAGQRSSFDVGEVGAAGLAGAAGGALVGGVSGGVGSLRGLAGSPRDVAVPPAGRVVAADPVDVVSGDVLLTQTDVALAGVLPLVLSRTHVSSYRGGRWFGGSWSSTLDQRLEVDGDRVCYAAADGTVLFYPLPVAQEDVLPVEGARWPLRVVGDGFEIADPVAGVVWSFAGPGGWRGDVRVLPLSGVVDRNGNRVDVGYDRTGAPVWVRHAGGCHVTVATEGGRIVGFGLADPAGGPDEQLVSFGYENGLLSQVVNSSGEPLRFSYDAAGRLAGWTDRNGHSYAYGYDSAGRCVRTSGSAGFLDAFLAYAPGRTTVTDSQGRRTVFDINEHRQVVRRTDPLGGATVFSHDRYDRPLTVTDPIGRTTNCTYDQDGNLVEVVRPDGRRTTIAWNGLRQPVEIVEAGGGRWRRTYDEVGNLLSITDPAGGTSRFTYDAAGAVVARTDPTGRTDRISVDAAGLPVTVTDPAGGVTSCVRDRAGRVVAVTDPVGGTTSYGWTPEGLLTARTSPDGGVDRWTYDGEGTLTAHEDPAGRISRWATGPFDRVVARTDPDGGGWTFAYDTELRLTAVHSPAGLTWAYEYDSAGRLLTETDFDGRTVRYAHDPAGQLRSRTTAGRTQRYAYDDVGNLVEQAGPDGTTSYAYDAAGRVVAARSPDSQVTVERDPVGRVVAETVDGRTVTTAYDAAGRMVGRTTPSGADSRYDWDPAGRLAAVRTPDGMVTFAHDPAGRETRRQVGGLSLTSGWDPAGRPVSQVLTAGPAVLHDRRYEWAADRTLTALDDLADGRRTFTHDQLGQVTAVTGHTPDGRDWTERYAYDPAGNLTTAAVPTPTAAGGPPPARGDDTILTAGTQVRRAGPDTYEHDTAGRLVRRIRRLPSGGRREWTYRWDSTDRLVEAATPDGRWRYTYDPFGRRTAKHRLSDTGDIVDSTLFTWAGDQLVEEHAAGLVRRWDHHPATGTPLTQTTTRWKNASQADVDRQFHAIVTDLVGTPTHLVDPTTADIAWHPRPTLWGVHTAAAGTVDCPLRFPGQYHDPETGLNYNHHRYYDPATATYLTPDPLGLTPGPNPHRYVTNPTLHTDPLGLAPDCNLRSATETSGGRRVTPSDLSAFGNRAGPRAPRAVDGEVGADGTLVPQEPPNPAGASTYADPQSAPLNGHYHTISAGTVLPPGLNVVRDGTDVGGTQPATHATIYATEAMTPEQFAQHFLGLPWEYGGRRK